MSWNGKQAHLARNDGYHYTSANHTIASSIRFPEDHSEKACVCGGHNTNHRKKDKQHHTALRKQERRFVACQQALEMFPEMREPTDQELRSLNDFFDEGMDEIDLGRGEPPIPWRESLNNRVKGPTGYPGGTSSCAPPN